MKRRLSVALAASVVLAGFAAHAQSTDANTAEPTSTTGAGMTSLPADWDDELRSTFFSDVEQGTLRSEEEVRQGWNELDAEQQARVTAYCDTQDTASTGTDVGTQSSAGSTATTGNGSMAGSPEPGAAPSSETTASTAGSSEMHSASMRQACGWIDDTD